MLGPGPCYTISVPAAIPMGGGISIPAENSDGGDIAKIICCISVPAANSGCGDITITICCIFIPCRTRTVEEST